MLTEDVCTKQLAHGGTTVGICRRVSRVIPTLDYLDFSTRAHVRMTPRTRARNS